MTLIFLFKHFNLNFINLVKYLKYIIIIFRRKMASFYKDNLEESEDESEDTNSGSEDTGSEDDCGGAAGTPSLPIATSLHTLTKTAINVK